MLMENHQMDKIKVAIRCVPYNLHVIKCIVYSKNVEYGIRAILAIDTGAYCTSISSDLADKLGYRILESDKPIVFDTAGGEEEMNMITISKICIPQLQSSVEIEIENLRIARCEHFNERYIDGVIGLDILLKYNIFIDFDNLFIELYERSPKILTP